MNQDPRLHYGTDVIPPWRESLLLSFQHYVTMFGAKVAIPLVLAGSLGVSEEPKVLG